MTIGSGTSHTLRAIVTPLLKWLSPLLVLRVLPEMVSFRRALQISTLVNCVEQAVA